MFLLPLLPIFTNLQLETIFENGYTKKNNQTLQYHNIELILLLKSNFGQTKLVDYKGYVCIFKKRLSRLKSVS